jgi:hypothetical protein
LRYTIRYDTEKEKWAVIDTALADQKVGLHQTAEAAVYHAFAEQELWQRYDPATEQMSRLMA